MSHSHTHVTRGFGVFEKFLAVERSKKANSLINPTLRSGSILDVGCGSFPHFLLSTQFHKKYGIDLMVHQNQKSAGVEDRSLVLKKVDLTKELLPFPNSSFTVVVMLAVSEHISGPTLLKLLTDARRVLQKNGQLILTTPTPWASPVLWLLSRIVLVSKTEIDDHKNVMRPQQLRNMLQSAGFSQKNISQGFFEFGFNMWFVAKK